jgi:PAS domain-containing protein
MQPVQRVHDEQADSGLVEERRQSPPGTNDTIWEMDPTTNRVWWNRGLETLLGYRADTGLDIAWFRDHVHPDDASTACQTRMSSSCRRDRKREGRTLIPARGDMGQ